MGDKCHLPVGISSLLRLGALGSIFVAAIMYVGIIAIICIKLGSASQIPLAARIAFPSFYWIFAILVACSSLYIAVLLSITKHRLGSTGFTLMRFMSLPLKERHALMKSLRKGPYRDA